MNEFNIGPTIAGCTIVEWQTDESAFLCGVPAGDLTLPFDVSVKVRAEIEREDDGSLSVAWIDAILSGGAEGEEPPFRLAFDNLTHRSRRGALLFAALESEIIFRLEQHAMRLREQWLEDNCE